MAVLSESALAPLERADGALRAHTPTPRSLGQRGEATPLAELGRALLPGAEPALARAWARGIAAILEAQIEHFPGTLFWDMDYLGAALLEGPCGEDVDDLGALCAEIVALQRQYGRHSVIAFRYTHDFTYGFDWAKWVKKDPSHRGQTRPFDPEFIRYLRRRGAELAELIAQDDRKYPKLPDGTPRNPFGFSRQPGSELRLFEELAARGLIPAHTWRRRAQPDWTPAYAQAREELAAQLCVPTRHAPDRQECD